jgi:hypothetical protein
MIRFTIFILLLSGTGLINAEDEPLWKTVGGWEIRVDTTLGNGCFTYQIYEGNTVLRIGVNKLVGGMYAMIGDADWKSLEFGKTYPIKLYFGNQTPWSGNAEALSFNGIPVLMLNIISNDHAALFLTEFMRELSVKVVFKNKSIAHLNLKGTYKAGTELLKCQKAFNKREEKEDPFESPETPNKKPTTNDSSDDPFAI